MTLLPDDIRAHSVTRDDPEVLNPGGRPQVLWFTFPQGGIGTPTGVLPLDLPLPWSRLRDRILISTVLHETMWAAAVQKVVTRIAALGFTTDDQAKSEYRSTLAQQRLLGANMGRGWVPFLTQHLLDFFTTDNGGIVELIYRTDSVRSQFLGFQHLDAMRCTRTGEPEIPIIYEDLRGRLHELRAHQVLTFVDMESGRAEARGTGLCAASRAYNTIHKLAAMERYVDEKVTGDQIKSIHLVNGISSVQLEAAVTLARQQQANRGAVAYMGSLVIPATNMAVGMTGYEIKLAGLPENFDPEKERSNGYTLYAAALGIPSTFLVPLSGQGLGTGKQAETQDDTADEFGVAAWMKQWAHQANETILPSTTVFTWTDKNDARKQKSKADIAKTRAETRKTQVEAGEITGAQALQLAADAGDVPDTFLPSDETPNDQMTDTEKPSEGEGGPAALPVAPSATDLPLETKADWTAYTIQSLEDAARTLKVSGSMVASKARAERITDVDALFDDAAMVAAARRLAEEARG
jgi:hypothetical protein